MSFQNGGRAPPPPGAAPSNTNPAQPRRPPAHLRNLGPVNPLRSKKTKPPPPRPAKSAKNATGAPGGPRGLNGPQAAGQGARASSPVPDEKPIVTPIVTTKREFLQGMRYHVLRFLPSNSSEHQEVNPTDEQQFTRPVRLHRRDGKADTARLLAQMNEQNGLPPTATTAPVDDKERERREAEKAVRQAEKDRIQSEIAPVHKQPKNKFKKTAEQVFQKAESKQRSVELRYEEALSWHIEDFDNKNIWEGTYEQVMSHTQVMLIQDRDAQGNNIFRMVPCDKWYKFAPKGINRQVSIEEAEKLMAANARLPRWMVDIKKSHEDKVKKEELASRGRMFTRVGDRFEEQERLEEQDVLKAAKLGRASPERPVKVERTDQTGDQEDIDYNADEEFQDDEENPLFEGNDDDTKEAQEKIKREQLDAAVFDLRQGRNVDKEEQERLRLEEERKKGSNKVRKALRKREKNYIYESDSDENGDRPSWLESEESSDTETDEEELKRLEEEEKKKAAEAAEKGEQAKTDDAPKPGTPSSRLEALKRKDKKSKKRVFSDNNASETSGNESSARKKQKMDKSVKAKPSVLAFGQTIGRPTSPTGSQSSATGGINKALKKGKGPLAKVASGASPPVSRPGSPAPGSSTPRHNQDGPPRKNYAQQLPTLEELYALVPETGGVALSALLGQLPNISQNPGHRDFLRRLVKVEKRAEGGKTVNYVTRRNVAAAGGTSTPAGGASPAR